MTLLGHLRRAVAERDAARPDGELLLDYVARRDEAAFALLVRRHAAMVWGVCRRLLPRETDAEDAFQATFLVLVKKAAAVEAARLGCWLHGVARTTALKVRDRERQRRDKERRAAPPPRSEPSPADAWDLDAELARLPEKYRLPIVLCDLEGRTLRDAAASLGWPTGTVAGRLARGRALLAERLARRGWSPGTSAVPAGLVESVCRSASAGTVPAVVATLAEGVLRTMFLAKLKLPALALGVCVVAFGLFGLAFGQSPLQDVPVAGDLFRKPAADPARAELDRLRGVWTAVGMRWDESLAAPPKVSFPRLTIVDDKASTPEGEYAIRIDPAQNPRHLDLSADGETFRFVYSLDGDVLRLGYRLPPVAGVRPKSLATPAGTADVVLELKRTAALAAKDVAPATFIFPLRNVAATDTARVLTEVFGKGRVVVVAEPVTNRIIVQGSPADVATIRKLIEQHLDKKDK